MVFAHLRSDERIGLGIALALHVALVAVLLIRPERAPVFAPPEKMTINLATDVGLEATAPEPVAESRAAIAPEIAPEPAPVAEPAPAPEPAFEVAPAPPRPVVVPPPPKPKPVPRATQAPRPKPAPVSTEPRRRPDTPSSRSQSTPAPRKPVASAAPAKPAGGSRVGADFLAGAGENKTASETRVPASQVGASAKASIVQAIARQLKPKWQGRAPDGPDADQLVTILAFRLNENGSLSGTPRVVRQDGINELNRNQAALHAEAAVKAVQLAAPFDLPAEYYNAWKSIDGARFDRNLSR